MNYGIFIKKIRIENNLSQKQVADLLKIERITYNHYETQEKIIPLERLNDFATIFNVSIDYLFNLSENKNYPNSKNEIIKENIGKRLKEFRKENKITQNKLAKLLNTTHSVISDYERGRYLISTAFLYTICKKYNISADYLLCKIDNPNIK